MKTFSYLIPLIILLAACSEKTQEVKEKSVFDDRMTVKTTHLESLNSADEIEALAVVISENEAKPSFKTGGVIARTFVKEGDLVRKGQLLATLHMQEIDASVAQALQAVSKAERDLARVKNLYADSVATLEQFQNAGTALDFAKKNQEIAEFNKQYSEVRSPIQGKVVKQILHEGEVTGPGTPVFAILGIGQADWKVMAGLIDKDWARIQVGDAAIVRLDAYPGESLEAKVSDKSVIGGDASGRINIELKMTSKPGGLAAGMVGKVNIKPRISTQSAYLPVEAITRANGRKATVFKNDGGKVISQVVSIGEISNGLIQIFDGVDSSDEIITTGAMYLENGDSIIVKN